MAAKRERSRVSKGVVRPKRDSKTGRFLKKEEHSSGIKDESSKPIRPSRPKKSRNGPTVHDRSRRANAKRKTAKQKRAKAKSKTPRKPPRPKLKSNTGNPAVDRIAERSLELNLFVNLQPDELLLSQFNKPYLEALGLDDEDQQVIWDYAIEKLHKRGLSDEQVLAVYRNTADFFINRISGKDYKGWRQLLDMIEQEDERFQNFMDMADLLDIDEGDAKDEWFSPTIE